MPDLRQEAPGPGRKWIREQTIPLGNAWLSSRDGARLGDVVTTLTKFTAIRLKEARRAVQVRAIKGVVENQKSESSGSDAGGGWDVLVFTGPVENHLSCSGYRLHRFAMGRRRGEVSRNDIIYSWSVFGEVITVTAPDGRQKRMHVGRDVRRNVAKILARELEEDYKPAMSALGQKADIRTANRHVRSYPQSGHVRCN